MGEFKKSAAYYKKALTTYIILTETSNSSFKTYVAAAQNFGELDGEMKAYDKAIELATDARNSYSELYRELPDEFLPYLATSLHNLEIFNLENGELEKAEHFFDQSLAKHRNNPSPLMPMCAQHF